MQTTLGRLALTLAVLSSGLWLAAAFASRAVCRRALAPLIRMATTARSIQPAEWHRRLPGSETGDELDDLSRAFNGLLDRLQEAFERQRRFTGDASHQLRTPLAALLGQVEVALRRDRPAEDYRRVLEKVQAQAGDLTRVVEALLFLARADAEAGLPDLEVIDLGAWTRSHLGRWSDHPRRPDLRLEIAEGQDLHARALAPLLGELVDNLLDNAVKYSRPGTPVLLRVGRENGSVTLSVEDEGCGLDAADQDAVFQPFYRSAEARRRGQPGVGLGLAIARRIAAAFGGSLVVESKPGRGSRFTLRLSTTG